MTKEKPREKWTRRSVRERTGWSDTQVRLVLAQLVDFEFVLQFGGGQGRRAFYQLADEPAKANGQAPRNLAVTSQSAHCEVAPVPSSLVAAAKAAEAGTSQTSPRGKARALAAAAS
jgi:hypothetical protein